MQCREAREMIHAACDEELSESDREGLLEHVSYCRECSQYERMMRHLKARVGAAAAVDAAAAQAVFARFAGMPGYGSAGGGRVFPAGFLQRGILRAAAAVVILAAAVIGVLTIVSPATSTASIIVKHHRLRMVGGLVLDTHSNCCKDLEQWFESQAGRPVHVPEIAYKGVTMDGGTLYKHSTGNTIFVAAYTIEGKPVTLCVCAGPNMSLGEGEQFTCGGISAAMNIGEDYTLISWREGLEVMALVTPFDAEKSKAIFATVE
jgi:anti-sigma factor RsiW